MYAPITAASLLPRALRRRGWSLMPGSAFSDLACRSSIKRMAAASMSRQSRAVDLKFLPLYQQALIGGPNPKPHENHKFASVPLGATFALEYRKICDVRSQDTSMSGDDLIAGEGNVNAS